jgi:hypothetical protein
MSSSAASNRKKKPVPLIEFGRSLTSNLIMVSLAMILFGIPALYTSMIADAGGMSVDSLDASTVGKPDKIAHVVKIFEGWAPPKLVTKHETHIKFDSSSHDYLNEKFRKLFPTQLPFGYFMYSVLKSIININYAIILGVHKMFYRLPESLTMLLAMVLLPILYFILYFLNMPLSVAMHLYHFKKYFISCVKDENDPSIFTETTDYGPINWIILIAYGYFGFLSSSIFIIPMFTILYCYISPLLVNCKLAKGSNSNYDFFQFLGSVLSYKRQLIMWILSFILLKVTASTLGMYPAIGCFGAIVVLAGLTSIFSKYIPACAKK